MKSVLHCKRLQFNQVRFSFDIQNYTFLKKLCKKNKIFIENKPIIRIITGYNTLQCMPSVTEVFANPFLVLNDYHSLFKHNYNRLINMLISGLKCTNSLKGEKTRKTKKIIYNIDSKLNQIVKFELKQQQKRKIYKIINWRNQQNTNL